MNENNFDYNNQNYNEQPNIENNPVEPAIPYYPSNIEVPRQEQPDPVNKKGLRIFAIILAAAVSLSVFAAVGYYFGVLDKPTKPQNLASKPTDTEMLSAADVYEIVDKSVVGVTAYNSEEMISGSGVIYTSDGYIIINDSLYSGISAAKFKVYLNDGTEYSAEFVAGDARSDLAVIKITDRVNLVTSQLGNSSELYVGEPIVAISRPTGATTKNNITSGIVSLLDSRQSLSTTYTMAYIQIDAALNPGSNGGAVCNMYGQIVGIVSSKVATTGYEGMGFAVPSVTVKKVVDSLIENGYVENRSRLGISYTEITSVQSDAQGIVKGLYVAEVSQDSDAYGKIEVGDVITGVNGKTLNTSVDLLEVIDNSKPGDVITLSVARKDNSTDTVSVKLIADKGGSSYQKDGLVGDNNQEDDNHNSSDFSFPFGD